MKKKARLLYSILFVLCLQTSISAQIYVDQNANGNNDGTSWANAFTDLQPALDAAISGEEVWVTNDTYLPTESPDGTNTDNRNKAFHFNKNIKLYGGFNGTETSIDERTPGDKTILSGDLGTVDYMSDNAYHVLITANLNNTALIDAFTITKGNADLYIFELTIYDGEEFSKNSGGGMYNSSSSPTITNTNFISNNVGHNGGGMDNRSSSPIIKDTNFINNTAGDNGGAISNFNDSSAIIKNVIFTQNTASRGGAMSIGESSPTIENTVFINNEATSEYGGGIYSFESSIVVINTIFRNNTANNDGGAIRNFDTFLTTINTSFSNNTANNDGGAIANTNSTLTITNTNFINNTANNDGGAMYNSDSSPTITNTVFWKNTADDGGDEIYNSSFSSPTGNNNASDGDVILFGVHVVPGIFVYLNDNNEPNFTDENNGDYTLQNNSPLIDTGLNSANDTALDFAGNPRIICTIDIGAYETPDSIKPTITAVKDQIVNVEGNSCNAILGDYTSFVTIADNCDANPIVIQSPAVGTMFSDSVQVILTVIDTSGNAAITSFFVTLKDIAAPVPDAVSLETINANCEVTSLPTPSATDACNGNVTVANNVDLPITEEGLTTIIWTFTDESGNITTQNQEVVINSLDVNVTKKGDTLIANSQEDVTYQWINCSNNAPINGETSDSFKATATGTYALEITTNEGCVFTSTCQDVDVITLNTEEITVNNFTLYPNPSQDIFNISFTTPLNNVGITVSSVTGSVILSKKYTNTNIIQLNLENEANGIYFLRVITPLGDKTIKLVKI